MALELLLEGGLYGHLNHLYDNPDMPFKVMKKVFATASSGELVGTEKTDGQNLYISYSVRDGKAKAARNKGNIKQGGMDAAGLAAKFGGRGALEKAFTESFAAFEQAVNQFNPEQQVAIFGEDANIFYNAEVMDPENANVINYDTKSLVIHQQGHSEFDRETGNVTDADVTKSVKALSDALEGVQQSQAAQDFTVQMNAMKTLQKLDGDVALNEAVARLEKLISSVGLSDKNTIGEYLVAKIKPMIEEKFPGLPNDRKKLLQKRIMGVKGIKVTDVTKGIRDKQIVTDIKMFVKQGKEIMGKVIAPLESIVHDFSVEMLRGLESAYILDNKKEIQRLADEVRTAKNAIEGSGRDDVMLVMTKHLQKLSDITTATEGFVFDWDGVTYKFTGNFAPANQILGMFKYGRGKMPAIQNEMINEEAGPRRVAVVPGGFKPPHAGHFLGAKYFLDKGLADEVYVLVSPKERVGHSSNGKNQVVVTKDMSLAVWNMYIDAHGLGGKMQVSISKNASPVGAAYDFMATMNKGDTIILGSGEKDQCDTRFNRAQDWSDKKGYGVTVDTQCTPMFGGGVSGTVMRRLLADDNKKEFFKYIAVKSPADKEKVWNVLTQKVTEGFNQTMWRLINEVLGIEESNTMAGGDIEGHLVGGKKQGTWEDVDVEAENAEQERLNKRNRSGIKSPKSDMIKEDEEIKYLDCGLCLARAELPQINSKDVADFRSWLSEQGVDSFETSMQVGELTPIQKEINMPKIESMMSKHSAGEIDLISGKPIMVSQDEYLIDGHHRWFALKELDPANEMETINIAMNISELLKLVDEYPKVSYKVPQMESKFMDALFSTLLEESQWGGFTGGAAPLDEPVRDSGPIPLDQLKKLWNLFTEMGLSPEAILQKPEFAEAGITDPAQLQEGYENFGGKSEMIKVGKVRIDIEDMELEPTKHGEERRFRHQKGGQGSKISKDAIIQAVDRAMGLIMNDYANGELTNNEAFHIRMKGKSKQVPALNVIAVLDMKKGPDTMKIITVMRKDDFKTDNFGGKGGQQKTYNVGN